MRLSDIMGNMDLTIWPQVALVIFIGLFIGIVIRTFSKSRRPAQEEASRIPLQDDSEHTEVNGHV